MTDLYPTSSGMSWVQQRAHERRADRVAAAEQARADADAASDRKARDRASRADLAQQRAAATARRRAAAFARLSGWAARHRVDLLIYPLAVASAVLAVPSMATFGTDIYKNPVGAVLPLLTELGMWAFALAVQARRRTNPDAPVWALQLGVWVFAAVAGGLNFAHGLREGATAGVVMGIASVAGVIAHQLVTAGGLRSLAERRDARQAGQVRRKVTAARRAAVRAAVAEVTADGQARLVVVPGIYRVRRPLLGRPRLVPAVVAGLPVDPPDTGLADTLAVEAAAWLAGHPELSAAEQHTAPPDDPATGPADGPAAGGGVATLDPSPAPPDLTGPASAPPAGTGDGTGKAGRGRSIPAPRTRSIETLRREFRAALTAGRLDPTSANSIRTVLRCAPARARALRDEYAGGDLR